MITDILKKCLMISVSVQTKYLRNKNRILTRARSTTLRKSTDLICPNLPNTDKLKKSCKLKIQ